MGEPVDTRDRAGDPTSSWSEPCLVCDQPVNGWEPYTEVHRGASRWVAHQGCRVRAVSRLESGGCTMPDDATCHTVGELRAALEPFDEQGPVQVVVDGVAKPAVVAEELYESDGDVVFGCTIRQEGHDDAGG
jgi:putative hemolysin